MIIDFHTHILPEIDDGSKSEEMSREMMREEVKQGTDIILLTPHFYPDRMSLNDFLAKREKSYSLIKETGCQMGLELRLGAEVAFFSGIGSADVIEDLKIEGTDLMLLEMPFRAWSKRDLIDVGRLIAKGFTPIIAHVERFYGFQSDKHIIDELMDMEVYVQVNAECLLGGWSGRRFAINLFKTGRAQLLGSDAHNMSGRSPNLGKGREILRKKLGEGFLKEMDFFGEELLMAK